MKKLMVGVVLSFALAGCGTQQASEPKEEKKTVAVEEKPKKTEEQKVSEEISHSLTSLSEENLPTGIKRVEKATVTHLDGDKIELEVEYKENPLMEVSRIDAQELARVIKYEDLDFEELDLKMIDSNGNETFKALIFGDFSLNEY
ncbi:hypothetical protein [Priestia megaterium]|uniref:hypothetical protein n=1 Tax=Priestia megaterium TaxID=1404 RepID=UPI00211C653C|nr:hypothetical protein [Priestia megaterium]